MNKEDSKFYEQVIETKDVFGGKVIGVQVEQVILPNGVPAIREVVRHNGAVAVLPFIDDKVMFVRQYRTPLEQETLEIPAGKINPDEGSDLLEVIKREMNEELGYTTEDIEKIISFFPSPGYSDEKLTVFKATNLEKLEFKDSLDDDEFLDVEALTLEEAKQQIELGYICDAKTIFAVNYWELMELNGE
ncbi:NUDIX hydrolase [Companilactobacillus metriopterae]|uniref:NUDIX hydrolase n=1 Tax=Companilactobacillus metriopterae TaxID=1909267 RepID=UPI00100AC763|nr:NUDIX hydrolase [Companilactobacillus metriopterae]